MGIRSVMPKMRDIVHDLLRDDPKLRDDDRKLIARVWTNQMGGKPQMQTTTAWDLMVLFATTQKLGNPESIRRMRQKLQEQHPELRGKSYFNRKNEELNIRDEIRNT